MDMILFKYSVEHLKCISIMESDGLHKILITHKDGDDTLSTGHVSFLLEVFCSSD